MEYKLNGSRTRTQAITKHNNANASMKKQQQENVKEIKRDVH